ncbi:MAG TPA: hydantoinase/oxoprolinase family protein, partial [bacterium]|nr:hydantoinase/oxoprolinase family protein [bacterium]
GGTTAKVGLVRNGAPTLAAEFEVGSKAITPLGEGKGSGYPVRTPVIDLVEVGAGGGSVAWIDGGGSLRVGPRSAGADPGPVCYGKGGAEPTITDANLALGRVDPGYFLGGDLQLDAEAARAALESRVARPLGISLQQAASGVVEIANAGMAAAMRLVSVQRGYDPREFLMVAFGGAGPLHANALAQELGIPRVLVPPAPGVASAIGLLQTDIRHEYATTRRQLLEHADPAAVTAAFQEFERQAQALLAREREQWQEVTLVRTLDLRYRGQSYELQVLLPPGALTSADMARVQSQFEEAHQRAYGYTAAEDPVEIVNLRLAAVGRLPALAQKMLPAGDGDSMRALKGRRPVWLKETAGDVECPVYDRYRLCNGDRVEGPAIIEELDASTLVWPGYHASVDQLGNLLLSEK